MTRVPLRNRRPQQTIDVTWHNAVNDPVVFQISYGFDDREGPDSGRIKEVFCTSILVGTDMSGIINDACIALSLLLQHGTTIGVLAEAFGEKRPEGEEYGPPASPIGAICRAGVVLEDHPLSKKQSPLKRSKY